VSSTPLHLQVLEKICAVIAADESRHEIAYTKIVDELFKRDPDGAMLAFGDMMRKQIVMPAHLMDDNEHKSKNEGRDLFADFSDVAQRLEVYTGNDYSAIMEHLIKRWDVGSRENLCGEAAAEQEYLMKLPDRIRKLSERAMARRKKAPAKAAKFSWVYDRPVQLI
jgi:acyl-[acyl-carrier-protein] desaturase